MTDGLSGSMELQVSRLLLAIAILRDYNKGQLQKEKEGAGKQEKITMAKIKCPWFVILFLALLV